MRKELWPHPDFPTLISRLSQDGSSLAIPLCAIGGNGIEPVDDATDIRCWLRSVRVVRTTANAMSIAALDPSCEHHGNRAKAGVGVGIPEGTGNKR